MYEAFLEERKQIQKEKRQQKEMERKEAMEEPVPPLPEKELCEYEKLRERNIKEREEAMAASDFFEDLSEYKQKIGLIDDTASLKSTESVTRKDKKVSKTVKTKPKQSKKGPQRVPPKGQEKETLDENKRDKESNRELILESQKNEDYRKEEINSKPIFDKFHIDEWYLHDCLE